jgi:hypothetical protein
MLQDSRGCVRVANSISWDKKAVNTGLIQTHHSNYSCNLNGELIKPCRWNEILDMIVDGVAETATGNGLAGCLNKALSPVGANNSMALAPQSEAQAYYMASRLYNAESPSRDSDLGAAGEMRCYCSDIANRLTGCKNTNISRTCTLDSTSANDTSSTYTSSINLSMAPTWTNTSSVYQMRV